MSIWFIGTEMNYISFHYVPFTHILYLHTWQEEKMAALSGPVTSFSILTWWRSEKPSKAEKKACQVHKRNKNLPVSCNAAEDYCCEAGKWTAETYRAEMYSIGSLKKQNKNLYR